MGVAWGTLNARCYVVLDKKGDDKRINQLTNKEISNQSHGFMKGYGKMLKEFVCALDKQGMSLRLINPLREGFPRGSIALIYEPEDYGIIKKYSRKFSRIRKKLYLAWESTNVFPKLRNNYLVEFSSQTLSWDDDLIKNPKVLKVNHPFQIKFQRDIAPFSRKKTLCLVAANKSGCSHFHNIYQKRREYIQFFSKHIGKQFEYFGSGWPKAPCYRGICSDKYQTIRNYKFALCFENARFSGYITEKIFDCFESGIVPIYLGAPNIEEYIPSNCYIRADKYSKPELLSLIKNMDEETYNTYLENIENYLQSKQAELFSTQQFVDQLMKCI